MRMRPAHRSLVYTITAVYPGYYSPGSVRRCPLLRGSCIYHAEQQLMGSQTCRVLEEVGEGNAGEEENKTLHDDGRGFGVWKGDEKL